MIRFVFRRLLWTIPTLLLDHVPRLRRHPHRHRSGAELPAAQPAGQPGQDPAVQGGQRAHGQRSSRSTSTGWATSSPFNWGRSIKGSRPVWPSSCKAAMANTIVLGGLATFVGIIVGLGIGILSALRPRSLFDQTSTTGAFVGHLGPALRRRRPAAAVVRHHTHPLVRPRHSRCCRRRGSIQPGHKGFDLVLRLKHLILPVIVVAIQIIAVYSRYMRASLLEVSNSDYLRTARAKGISERRILVRHALRNALIPIVTVAAIDIGGIIGGLIITERIFEYRGMGDFFLTAYHERRLPAVDAVDGLRRDRRHPVQPARRRARTPSSTRGSALTEHRSHSDLEVLEVQNPTSPGPSSTTPTPTSPVSSTARRVRGRRRRVALAGPAGAAALPAQPGRRWSRSSSSCSSCWPVFVPEHPGAVQRDAAVAEDRRQRCINPPPSAKAWFGTDDLNRDLYSRSLLRRPRVDVHRHLRWRSSPASSAPSSARSPAICGGLARRHPDAHHRPVPRLPDPRARCS